MEKLSKLKVEKFRILKDSELKQIVGSSGSCAGTTQCGSGACDGYYTVDPCTGIISQTNMTMYHPGTCTYSSIARQCVCS